LAASTSESIFCYPCFMATLANQLDECVFGPFCFGDLFVTPMRTKLRTMHGIKVRQYVCCTSDVLLMKNETSK
jgi:hypothetical protein